MAKKENEENKDVNQESEEDFGLPDLEFEELDDIDDDEGEEDLEDEIAEIMSETSDQDTDESDQLADISASDESDTDSLGDIGISDETTDDVDTGGGDELDEVEKFISEITSDDPDDSATDVTDDIGSELDDIASDEGESLEEVGTEMFDSVETDDSDDSDEYSYSYDDEEDGGTSSSFTRIIIFGLVGAVIAAFAFLYFSDGEETTTAAVETPAAVEEPVEEEPVAEEPVTEETPATTQEEAPVQEAPVQTAATPQSTGTPGEITTISSSAGRYYIVVASFIDDDMAKDHANDLASQGASVKIVEPFNNRKFYRVSIADYGSRGEAISATEQLKSQYGNDIWALKY